MVVLLVAYDVYHLVDGEVAETHLGRTDVLRHVHAGTVRTQQQFLVQSVISEVCPYAVVVLSEEKTLCESLFHLCLSLEVSI